MKESNELRGLIYSRYKSKVGLAKALGWSPQRLHKTLANPINQPWGNLQKVIVALGLENDPISLRIFLPVEATKSSDAVDDNN